MPEARRMNISIPEQVSIIGFNDLPGNEQMLPTLSSLHTPRRGIGAAASDMLLKLMRKEPVPQRAIALGFTLVTRDSS